MTPLQQQAGGILLALTIFVFCCICLLFAGCVGMSSRGIEKMEVAVPALFQLEMEYHDNGSTGLDLNAGNLGFDGLPWKAAAVEPVIPIDDEI